MSIEIITNNHEREIIYGADLPKKELEWWKDLLEDCEYDNFFKYKGDYYYLGDFMRIPPNADDFIGWDGYKSDSFFSGILVKYADEYGDDIIVGRYYS